MKRIIVSVTNDLTIDNRVHKVCKTLQEMGFEILLTGRRLKKSGILNQRPYPTLRFRLLFNKGPLFYFEYNVRLMFFLLFNRFDVLLSNDLDTLPANFVAARIKGKKLVYDSHEYFTEVPELVNRPFVRKIWQTIEKIMVPRVDAAYTVCNPIAEIYSKQYKIKFSVVRNVPERLQTVPPMHHSGISGSKPVILYQGAINTGRGLELAIGAMDYLPEADLIIIGAGDREELIKQLAGKAKNGNIKFRGRLPIEELFEVTCRASLGISLEENTGLNYRYALPNKLFDYIQARVPVIVSNLPEMRKIVVRYNIGLVSETKNPVEMAELFRIGLNSGKLRAEWKKNLEIAAEELNWDREKTELYTIFEPFA